MQLLDDWQTGIPPSSRLVIPEAVTRSSRALQVTSGNAQPYNLEHPKSEEFKAESGDIRLPFDLHPHNYPEPPTLRSNAPRTITASQRLEQRRLHRAARGPPRVVARRAVSATRRGYLQLPKYLEYRARPRRDTGADGEPVWPDELEEVFQDALIAIKPMGRRKLSQNGKACGRNELIASYIEQWTGKSRDRKQVSSHIQVLGQILKGDPQWVSLIRESDQADSQHVNFYHDSITDLVAQRKFEIENGQVLHVPPYTGALPSPIDFIPSNGAAVKPVVMTSLDFVMWVNGPNQENRIEDAIHTYTRLQSDLRLPEQPLEDLRDWRYSYPCLADLIDDAAEPLNCELILLDTSLELMLDFPPPRSKLGINHELDFVRGSCRGEPSDFVKWSCNTVFYEDGKVVNKRQDTEPHVTSGQLITVRPAFESSFWANRFVQITERRRSSEEAPEDADEQSRQSVRLLTAMQEIRAVPVPWDGNHGKRGELSQHHHDRQQSARIAIILWKFHQARPGEVGTTLWQKLILPPVNRVEINSPLPTVDLGLPPMIMDAVVSEPQDGIDNHHGENTGHGTVPIYESGGWDESALSDHHDFDFFNLGFPGIGPEGDHSVIPEMNFDHHLELGGPEFHHHQDTSNFQGGHIVIHRDQYGPPHEHHLSFYHGIDDEHQDGHGSFPEHDLHSSNVVTAIFNQHLPHDTNHGNFGWDPTSLDTGTDHIPLDGSLGIEDSRLKSRQRSVVEDLFPEETGTDDHKIYENE